MNTVEKINTIEDQVDEMRRNLAVYNRIQTSLITRRHGNSAHNPSRTGALGMAVNWIDTYSPEYETAFKELVRESIEKNENFLDKITHHTEESIQQLEDRIEQYHLLELRLIKHIDPHGKIPESFIDWHKEFGKSLTKILYLKPELFKRYLDAQDLAPEAQEEVLREIEDALYMQEA